MFRTWEPFLSTYFMATMHPKQGSIFSEMFSSRSSCAMLGSHRHGVVTWCHYNQVKVSSHWKLCFTWRGNQVCWNAEHKAGHLQAPYPIWRSVKSMKGICRASKSDLCTSLIRITSVSSCQFPEYPFFYCTLLPNCCGIAFNCVLVRTRSAQHRAQSTLLIYLTCDQQAAKFLLMKVNFENLWTPPPLVPGVRTQDLQRRRPAFYHSAA